MECERTSDTPQTERPARDVHLAIVSQRVIAEKHGRLYAPPEEGSFLNDMAERVGRLTVYAPLGADPQRAVLPLSADVKVRALPDRLREHGASLRGAVGALHDWADQIWLFLRGFSQHDAIYVFQPSSYGCLAALAARLRRRPYAVYLGGAIEGLAGGSRWARLRIIHRLFGWIFSAGIFLTLRGARFIIAPGRVPFRERLPTHIPIIQAAPRVTMTPQDIYERSDTCEAPPYRLLTVGRLTGEKGVGDLLQAVRPLLDAGLDVQLDVVGSGGAQAQLEALAGDLEISDCVVFVGAVPNGPRLFAYYRRADIFVMPSWREGFPRVLFEAAGHSLPIVTTDVGAIPDRMENGIECLMVPAKAPAETAEAIRRLIADGEFRRNVIASALAHAKRVLSTSPAEQLAEVVYTYLRERTLDRKAGQPEESSPTALADAGAALTVCQVGSYPPPISGVGAHIEQLANRLRAVGIQVRIANTSPPQRRLRLPIVAALVDLTHFLWVTTFAVMQKSDVHHVHVTTGASVLARLPLLCALRALRRPVVLTLHSGNLPANLAACGPATRWLTCAAFRLADHILVTGAESVETMCRIAGRQRVSDVSLFLGEEKPDEDAIPPEALQFAERHRPLIVVAGGWRPLYDFETAVDALAILSRNARGWPDLGAIFLTSFSRNDSHAYRKRILERVKQHGLEERVTFLRPGATAHSGVLALLRRSQALVRSSRSDATGLIIHEAMSQGCPAVASDIGTRPSGCALYPTGDAQALADVLEEMLRRCRPPFQSPSSGDENLARIVAVYQAVSGRRTPYGT